MTFSEAMKKIESHEFAVRVNLASDYRNFLRAAQQEESVQTFFMELSSANNRMQVVSRIAQLVNQLVDLRYENPWDVAFTVYLWLLDLKDPSLSKIAAQSVAQVPQCWWSKIVANQILMGERLRSDAGLNQQEVPLYASAPKVMAQALDASEGVLPAGFHSYTGLMQLVGAVADRKTEATPFLQEQWGTPFHKYSFKSDAYTEMAA